MNTMKKRISGILLPAFILVLVASPAMSATDGVKAASQPAAVQKSKATYEERAAVIQANILQAQIVALSVKVAQLQQRVKEMQLQEPVTAQDNADDPSVVCP
jgi:TolA-binding protein